MAPQPDSVSLYLYGDRNPRLSAAMIDRQFLSLLGSFFSKGERSISGQPPAALQTGIDVGLLTTDGDRYQPGPRLVVVPAHAEEAAALLMRPAFAPYVEVTAEVAAELEACHAQSSIAARFRWEEVAHTLVAGMFLDLAMGAAIHRSGHIRRPPVGDSVVWALEKVSGRNPYGVQIFEVPRERAFVAQLWHRRVQRQELRLHARLANLLVELGRVTASRGDGQEITEKDRLALRYLRFLREQEGSAVLQAPVFTPADTARLLPVLSEGAARLVDYAIVPALERLRFDTWWRDRIDVDAYRHVGVRLALEYGIDCTIGAGVLPPFPEGTPPHAWGRWIWIEPDDGTSVLPSMLGHARDYATA